MSESILITMAEVIKITNLSPAQAYRMVPTWKRLGIVVMCGEKAIRINRKKLLAWAGETVAA